MLKISNAHRYWAEHRIKNEVYTMQYLIEHATIPISKRIDYSTDFKTHVLSCEYTLMEKIYGNTLESVIEKISDQNLVRTALEMTDYVKQLRQIKLPQENRIGSFSSKQMFLGGSIEDGPTLPRSNDTVRIRTVLSGAVLRTVLHLNSWHYGP
ncbi:unnamed protein product [Rotaria magnacalcarata]|uniref:Uncharacterized protein n=1 Tax=Rotaria magnacalcarata TaxID=392030 RepID=A0A819E2X5_9BILA|nr:unnamed protein product [Rotaria magnacalcarata]CAF3844100.1 unnamed protein product [Rotaria magnacalcarata]